VSKDYLEKENQILKNFPFDSFLILNFLEHIPNIRSFLKGIWNNLSEEAIGLIEVPNFDMMLRKKLFSEFTTDHLYYFTKDTLISTLNINGFEVIECKEVWYDYILSVVVRKRKTININDFSISQNNITNELNLFINKYKHGNVAIWGAGHQALALIALSGIKDKIKYVIDSAEFKQGKYTPATHIPIVSPDILKSEPVNAIIVMAASYSDEVVRIIQEKYNDKIDISILRDFGLEIINY
jgi:hypothetical protein